MLGYDPEGVAGFTDADIEMHELAQLAGDIETEAKATLIGKLGRFPTSDELAAEIDRLYADGFGG